MVTYDKVYNAVFHQTMEVMQCYAALAITHAINDSSKDSSKLYQALRLVSLQLFSLLKSRN